MHRTSLTLASALVFAAGCGQFGGAGAVGRTIAPITTAAIDTAIAPAHVTRDPQGYTWTVEHAASSIAGSRITATGTGAVSTDVFVGVSPLGHIDHVSASGGTTEAELVFDPSSFAVVGSRLFASTSNALAARAGSVFSRDDLTGQWALSRDGTARECVLQALAGTLYAFSGESGAPLTVSALTTSSWTDVAAIASTVPQAVAALGSDLWVGGRSNAAGGRARLFHGSGTSFTEEAIPVLPASGEVLGVAALGVAHGVLYVALEAKDVLTGATLRGALLALHPVRRLVPIASFADDAPIALAALDGTIYAGTRSGKVLWLDERLALHEETAAPCDEVGSLLANGGLLQAGTRTSTGAKLLTRQPRGGNGSGMAIVSLAPNAGPAAGGTPVTIDGSGFAGVTQVTIGGVPLSALAVTATRITGTTGAHAAGPADVVVVAPQGQATLPGGFTYQGAQLTFASDMQPFFGANGKCSVCHRPGGAQAAHPLTTYTEVVTGVSTVHTPAAYVVPGQPAQSLIGVLAAPGGSMAAMAALTPAESARIVQWLADGALP